MDDGLHEGSSLRILDGLMLAMRGGASIHKTDLLKTGGPTGDKHLDRASACGPAKSLVGLLR